MRALPGVLPILACAVGFTGSSVRAEARAPDYSLEVRVLPAERRLEVTGTVRVPALDSAREEIIIDLLAEARDFHAEIIEPAVSAGPITAERVSVPAERVEGERLKNTKWILRPSRAIPAEEPTTIRFSYLADGNAALLYYVGPEVAFASGWGDPWYPVVKGVGGEGTGALTVHAPDGWKVFTGPRLSKPTHLTFVAGPYTVTHRDGPVPLNAWLLSPRGHIDGWLAGVSSMLDTLIAEFGPFPFDELALVEVPRAIAKEAGFNAFSPAGFLVLNSRAFDAPEVKYLLEWLGHEMGHQWFPHAISFDPVGFLYMEEALAEYGGLRIVERLAGSDAAHKLRTSGFEFDPIYSAAAYFRMVGAGVDQPLAEMKSGINERNLAYNKGALVFDMLSREIGREKFQQILAGITRGRHMETMTWQEFLDACRTGSGRKLDWFFDQWLHRAGAPDFKLSWHAEKEGVRGIITQSKPYYRAHLTIEARGSNGERATRVVEIIGARASVSFAPGFPVTDVVLDPDYQVLRWTSEYRVIADTARADPPTR